MKIKINNILAPAVAMIFSASLTSCMADLDKGNINPKAESTPNIMGLYSKCYASFIMEGTDGSADFTIDDAGKSTLVRNVYNFNELSTDEGICWWSDGGISEEVSLNKVSPSNATLRFLYYRLACNIAFCNNFLQVAQDKTMLAEVRFIRAYNYFLELDFFGDPTFTTTISGETPMQAHAYHKDFDATKSYTRAELLKMGREYMFTWLVDELKAAEVDMLEPKAKTDSDPDYGRADKAAAWQLLARLYLNAGTYLNGDGQNNPYWKEAKEYAEKVINSGYSLFTEDKMSADAKNLGYKPYDLLFMGDNGSSGASCEAVLPLKQDGLVTQGWGGSMFMIAALWDPNMTSVIGISPGTTANNWSGMRLRPAFIEKFVDDATKLEGKSAQEIRALGIDDRLLICGTPNADGDKRTASLKNNSAFIQGLPTVKWNNNYSNGGTPHDGYCVDTDYFLFRLAEVYLIAAEADMHLNGEGSATAKKYLDAIRNRANAATKSSYTLDDVLDERARELYTEGHRRTDLIRFNQFGGNKATYSWEGKGGTMQNDEYAKGGRFEEFRNVYPLPTSEVQANRNLTQIDGYNETE